MSITPSDHILCVNGVLDFNALWIHYESVPAHMSGHVSAAVTIFWAKHHLSINVDTMHHDGSDEISRWFD